MTMNREAGTTTLADLGYSEFFSEGRTGTDLTPARVIAEHKELYVVRNETAELSARITGKMMFNALSREDYPAAGDWVLVTVLDEEQAIIHEILPRRTVLKRKAVQSSDQQLIAANVDVAMIVQAPDRDYSLNRFERYITLAESGGIDSVIVLNKTDLITGDVVHARIADIEQRFPGVDVHSTSTVSNEGIAGLRSMIRDGQTYCFLGSSGVGKSSIINSILGDKRIRTAEISDYADRGKHVTTHRELFVLETGGILIDNPGMREIGVLDSRSGIENVFSEISELAVECRYMDCSHVNEPGCAVLDAVSSGQMDRDRYDNYIKLVKENEYNRMSGLEKREKDRKFGRFLKTAKKRIKRYRS